MNVKEISRSQEHIRKWNNYAKKHPRGTFYHLFEWGVFLEEIYPSFKFIPLCVVDDSSDIVGLVPLIIMRNHNLKKIMVSLPFFSIGGILADSKEVELQIIKAIEEYIKKESLAFVLLKSISSSKSLQGASVDRSKSTFILPLNKDHDSVFSGFQKQIRRRIRKGYKSGCHIDMSSDYFRDFYKIYVINMKRLGSPVHKISFYRSILKKFPKSSNILAVKLNNRVIGAQFLIFHGTTVYLPLASSLSEYNKYSPNHLLYWESIKYGCENGYELCDFGRSTVGSGPYIFKKQWNPVEIPLPYYFFQEGEKMRTNSVKMYSGLEVFSNIWKRMPLNLTKIIGPYLAKRLP